MSLLNSVLKVFVGDKTKKDLAKILPLIDQINSHFNAFKDLTNDELRNKTNAFKTFLSENTVKPIIFNTFERKHRKTNGFSHF